MKTLISIFFLIAAGAGIAQEPPTQVGSERILNGKAVRLPKPAYPEALKGTGTSGVISVSVEVDETGTVISAEASPFTTQIRTYSERHEEVAADPILRAAAEDAARNATFLPTIVDGKPQRVIGRIIYNFVGDTGSMGPLPKTINGGGVLNGKATSLPKPIYPAAAKAVRAQGAVSVQVEIDEEGVVKLASAVSGHPLLRSAAENAAYEARFAPTLLSGTAVKVTGIVTYNFVLPAKDDQ
jgi:TonB family protein